MTMSCFDKMKMQLLDELEKVLDQHDVQSYMDGKSSKDKMAPHPEPDGDEMLAVGDNDGDEMAAVVATAFDDASGKPPEGKYDEDSDPIIMRGQFAKRKGRG
jgi:hypothetical protein